MASSPVIAFVLATPGTTWGGMERHTSDLARGLAERGYTILVFAHPAYEEQFKPPVRFQSLPVELGRNDPRLIWRLRQLIKLSRPDICHAQGNKAATLLNRAIRLLSDLWRPISIGTVHGSKSTLKAFAPLDGAIAVSRDILESLHHPQGKLIHNGIAPLEPAGNPRFPLPNQRPLLIAAGRLEPVKQFDRLIEAWSRRHHPGVLVILGEGSERPRLLKQISDLELTDSVLLPGQERNLIPWFEAAAACIISSAREGFPYVMIEALMTGCPVVSTPVSDARELLPASCLAPSDSIQELSVLIDLALSPAASLRKLQRPCFEAARSRFTLETMIAETERYYRSLLAPAPEGIPGEPQ